MKDSLSLGVHFCLVWFFSFLPFSFTFHLFPRNALTWGVPRWSLKRCRIWRWAWKGKTHLASADHQDLWGCEGRWILRSAHAVWQRNPRLLRGIANQKMQMGWRQCRKRAADLQPCDRYGPVVESSQITCEEFRFYESIYFILSKYDLFVKNLHICKAHHLSSSKPHQLQNHYTHRLSSHVRGRGYFCPKAQMAEEAARKVGYTDLASAEAGLWAGLVWRKATSSNLIQALKGFGGGIVTFLSKYVIQQL